MLSCNQKDFVHFSHISFDMALAKESSSKLNELLKQDNIISLEGYMQG